MRATGSATVVLEEVFVPAHRVAATADVMLGDTHADQLSPISLDEMSSDVDALANRPDSGLRF
ncbi:MAG: hypothetical protein ABIR32_09425 [Ilumatobacteraceae bacterium]